MDIESQFVHLARMVSIGDFESATAFSKRTFRSLLKDRPDLSDSIGQVLSSFSANLQRNVDPIQPLPVDVDSRLELLRREIIETLDIEPVWSPRILEELTSTVLERKRRDELISAGLTPTRSLLLVGPPGVGKTLSAHWLARELSYPLLTLDLAGVMSSFLGRTGSNIRVVLDYAQRYPSILLLDEFDAIAKRRDDIAEIGELKRLVTVLLQAVDDWPEHGLLIAATNHPELLDPAVWRRFDRIIEFPFPTTEELTSLITNVLDNQISEDFSLALSIVFTGKSFSDVVKLITNAKRKSIISHEQITDLLIDNMREECKRIEKNNKYRIAELLINQGISERKVSDITGVSRDTLRKHRHQTNPKDCEANSECQGM